MHILYIHQYFATPSIPGGGRSYEFAQRWVERGHKVTMLTTTCKLAECDMASARGRFIKRFNMKGIEVIAAGITYKQDMGIFRRLLAFLCFVVVSSLLMLSVKKVDVVYATSTPLTVGLPALVAKWVCKTPFVFEVRDRWPQVPIEMGIIKNRALIGILLLFEKTIYKYSSAIVVLSPGQAESVGEVLTEDKRVMVIPNCSDVETFRSDIDGSSIRSQYGWGEKLVFLHAGKMGRVNSLNFVLDVAVTLKQQSDILFVLIGEGKEEQQLKERVARLGLINVDIFPAVPRQQMPEIYAAADVGLVIIGNWPIIEHNSANKFFDSLSVGKPVLLNYSGWQRDVLEANNAGFGCTQYNLEEFVEKVLWFKSNKEKLADMGNNARALAEKEFDRDKLAMQALEVVERVMDT